MGLLQPADAAGHKNMLQLVQLRWLAVIGQLVTIAVVQLVVGIALPWRPMMMVLIGLLALNVASIILLRIRTGISGVELFAALLFDVGALTAQLYLSGGATNPFVSLFLLQVVLGSVLLDRRLSWVIVGVTSLCFAGLMIVNRPLAMPMNYPGDMLRLHVLGMWISFAIIAVLLVLFVTRISGNLRARDAYLADIRQQAAEQDHIVRIGLLASGAAHELGTPLASLAVILGDWRRMPVISDDPQLRQEIREMEAEVKRCKAILSGILLSAGETRGEAPTVTTVQDFLDDLVLDWRATRPSARLQYENNFGADLPIVSDTALKQTICNVLDNAAEASPEEIKISARRERGALLITISDRGPGFSADMLANIGKPYNSTKNRPGSGLGLFLVVNVMRKLGGDISARNLDGLGAEVTLTLPLSAVAFSPEAVDVG